MYVADYGKPARKGYVVDEDYKSFPRSLFTVRFEDGVEWRGFADMIFRHKEDAEKASFT